MELDWARTYDSCWERPLEAVVWMPIHCDTPSVVADRTTPSFYFSGAVLLAFEGGGRVTYTWTQSEPDRGLDVVRESDFTPFALDQIVASPEDPWSAVWQAKIEKVDLFAHRTDDTKRVLSARHSIRKADGSSILWVSVAFGRVVEVDGDDLLVSIGVEPGNVGDLVLVNSLTCPERGRP